uniref:BGGP Beta-1-3-galactosyl-O-glycosyl-glycoprotein n=1 Tax=Oryza glumipatula TaxID=40148 RepID=A0A0E0BAV8_9ORYZ
MRSPVGRREVVVSGVFTALLVLSILSLPSLLLTGPAYKSWPFLAAARDSSTGSGGGGGGAGYYPVSFAYLISASTGDAARAARLLAALYHPANCYLLHLDREAPVEEHRRLAELVSGQPVYARAGNVWIVGRPNLVTYRGPTMLSTTLHAVAMLLRLGRRWDWFVNLSASDYPLVTQDAHQPPWLEDRARPVILDTALYEADRSELIRPANLTTNRRNLPTAFKLFTGSAWTMMSRQFAEYFTVGYDDNLPRTLLLYYTNFVSSPEFYFQTLACNSRRFRNTTVNHDLHFIRWDSPPKQHPLYLGPRDYRRMLLSAAPFARKFREDDPVLDRIDRDILRRDGAAPGRAFAYGGWCSEGGVRLCSNPQEAGRKGMIKAGAGSRRLRAMLNKMMNARNFRRQQCR